MRSLSIAAALLATLAVAGCGGPPPTILPPGPMTEQQSSQVRRDFDLVTAQERANLAGKDYVPRDEEQERVQAEERANLATTPRR